MNKSLLYPILIAMGIVMAGMMVSTGCSKPVLPDWYTVTGTGVADESLPPAQARLMAMRAAREDAWRQLLEAAKGIQIDSATSVRDFIAQDDAIRSRVMGVIRGAQQIGEPRYLRDGSVEIDMRLDMNRVRYLVR